MARIRSDAAQEAYGPKSMSMSKNAGKMKDMMPTEDEMEVEDDDVPVEDVEEADGEVVNAVETFINGLDPEQLDEAYTLICARMDEEGMSEDEGEKPTA